MMYPDSEQMAWINTDPDDLWVMDKLILGRKLGHVCGPIGQDVPKKGYYCVRPPVNAMGFGFETEKLYLIGSTDHLRPGLFWNEWYEGRHISVDYINGEQVLAVEGFRREKNFTIWEKWIKVDVELPIPEPLKDVASRYRKMNIEFIGGRPIEVHFRSNQDFQWGNSEFIPFFTNPYSFESEMYENQGYTWVRYPGDNGRLGAFIK